VFFTSVVPLFKITIKASLTLVRVVLINQAIVNCAFQALFLQGIVIVFIVALLAKELMRKDGGVLVVRAVLDFCETFKSVVNDN